MTDELLTPKEAAEVLKVAEITLASWRNAHASNGLPFVRVGRLIRYKRSDLAAFIARNTEGQA